MTKPIIGQAVQYWPARTDSLYPNDNQPLLAFVCGVPEGDLVNLAVFDRKGSGSTNRLNVPIIDTEPPNAAKAGAVVLPGAKTLDAGESPLFALQNRVTELERTSKAAADNSAKVSAAKPPAPVVPPVPTAPPKPPVPPVHVVPPVPAK